MPYGVGKYGTGIYGLGAFSIGQFDASTWLPQTSIEGLYVSHAQGTLAAEPALATLHISGLYIPRDGLLAVTRLPVLQISGSYSPPPIPGSFGAFLPKPTLQFRGRRLDPYPNRLKAEGILEMLWEAREFLNDDQRLGTVEVRKISGPEDLIEPFILLLDSPLPDRVLWEADHEDQGVVSGPPEEFLVEVKQILLGS